MPVRKLDSTSCDGLGVVEREAGTGVIERENPLSLGSLCSATSQLSDSGSQPEQDNILFDELSFPNIVQRIVGVIGSNQSGHNCSLMTKLKLIDDYSCPLGARNQNLGVASTSLLRFLPLGNSLGNSQGRGNVLSQPCYNHTWNHKPQSGYRVVRVGEVSSGWGLTHWE